MVRRVKDFSVLGLYLLGVMVKNFIVCLCTAIAVNVLVFAGLGILLKLGCFLYMNYFGILDCMGDISFC